MIPIQGGAISPPLPTPYYLSTPYCMPPSIYVLRTNLEKFPDRNRCSVGDIVILPSGDVLVYAKNMWDLLPGSYISIEELKEFISYVSSGWPEDPDTAREDLRGRIPEIFLSRMLKTVSKIQSTKEEQKELTDLSPG